MERTRVMLADDHPGLRGALRALIGLENDLLVIGEVDSGEAAVANIAELRPDVLVIDVNMPGIDGIEAIRRVRKTGVDVRIVVLTAESEREHLQAAVEAGARAYVGKAVADREIVAAIRTVARGGSYLPPRAERFGGVAAPGGAA